MVTERAAKEKAETLLEEATGSLSAAGVALNLERERIKTSEAALQAKTRECDAMSATLEQKEGIIATQFQTLADSRARIEGETLLLLVL